MVKLFKYSSKSDVLKFENGGLLTLHMKSLILLPGFNSSAIPRRGSSIGSCDSLSNQPLSSLSSSLVSSSSLSYNIL